MQVIDIYIFLHELEPRGNYFCLQASSKKTSLLQICRKILSKGVPEISGNSASEKKLIKTQELFGNMSIDHLDQFILGGPSSKYISH